LDLPSPVVKVRCEPGGRFIVVDEFDSEEETDPARLGWRLARTLADPLWTPPTAGRTRNLLTRAGFANQEEWKLAERPGVGGRTAGPTVLEARRLQ
jgi:hypothetical protein